MESRAPRAEKLENGMVRVFDYETGQSFLFNRDEAGRWGLYGGNNLTPRVTLAACKLF